MTYMTYMTYTTYTTYTTHRTYIDLYRGQLKPGPRHPAYAVSHEPLNKTPEEQK